MPTVEISYNNQRGTLPFIMKMIVVLFLMFLSINVFGRSIDLLNSDISTVEINAIFDQSSIDNPIDVPDLVIKEELIGLCINEYKSKQEKSYDKSTEDTLYDLINNFKRIVTKIYGKKTLPDIISFEEKIDLLSRVECETYFALGVLN